jgi:hypothetical protein
MKTNDLFWLNNPMILIDPKRLNEFFPHPNMTKVEQLNAITRFSIYLAVILTMIKMEINYIYIAFIGFITTFLIYHNNSELKNTENLEKYEVYKNKSKENKKTVYVKPSYDNPFMNPTLLDINNNPDREAYSKKSFINNEELKNEIEDKFSYNLYQDASDVFGKSNSQRQFYTTPNTTIPNKQDDFAQWLYGKPESCKQNNGFQCINNNPRFLNGESRSVFF